MSHAEKNRDLQWEIEKLKRELRYAKRKRAPSYFDEDPDDEPDVTYQPKSRTPASETYTYEQESPHKGQRGSPSRGDVGSDAMSKALNQISRSPFTCRIEEARLPRRFNQPAFTIYNGKTDPVEHVSHFNQRMAVYSRDEALMCKVFPSSLGPVAMRWFDGLSPNSISSFKELTQAFGSRFVTCRRVARPLSSLLSLTMKEGEFLKVYSDRYWEMFNDMEGNFDAMTLETFKLGLPTDHGLRTSLSGKPVTSIRQLMDRIEKYKRVEEDQQQGKGKEKVIPLERRDFRSDQYTSSKPRRDFPAQSGTANPQTVNTVFRDPVHQVLAKVKNEPFFKWPNKMAGNPDRRNRNLYCQYHQDHGHTTEDCRDLWIHLEQLVNEGKLRHLLHHTSSRGGLTSADSRRDDTLKPSLGTINVIFAAPGRTGPSRPRSCLWIGYLWGNLAKVRRNANLLNSWF
ncbi:uncharacterized protein LOC136065555 [Quercus suber]|uniref:uncharacterized protein LOC136065555 n=1 Tax=Quercus suber TaxID=58331 RepID=UPI0032E04E11